MIDFYVVGRRLKYYRKKSGLTQSQVAEALDVSTSYISQIERGSAEVSLKRLAEISDIIHSRVEYLIADTDIASRQYLNSEIYQITKDWDDKKKDLLLKLVNAIDTE